MAAPQVLTAPEAAETYADAWRALAAGHPWTSYFCTPDWQLSWWEVLGSGRDVRLAVWPGDGGLDAVVGLVREPLHPRIARVRGPWAPLGSGAGAADHLGWLVRPERHDDVRRWLAETVGRSSLLLPASDPESRAADLVTGADPIATTACPRVDLPDDPLPTGSSKLRKRVRYDERKLAEEGVTTTWLSPGQVTGEVLDHLLRLHGSRAGDQGWATSFTAERRRLHLALLARATPGCGPAAVVARRDDEVVGVLYGFLWQRTFAYYQTGWDEAYARHGLGTVLVAAAMRAARDAGCEVFDFLRGAEPYKYRFGAVDRTDTTWLAGRGPVARVVRARYADHDGAARSEEDAGAPALRD
ncbi:GNAT family N-acetyltransferase [Nocardioides euryhalodurans]|uniref:GNAT family N-acetyltransferase n=1 Tax=Nocardioides euryhalodurans TaxID=2518370 RepID=A0A4P7GHE2_9ACTN|nr:GNAT family N-acetyltransferase [Nocardioides euryhalodurans]QBR91164.1 GNAT family N-acetyltransferase [Nocardioides euryhalodurans]